jgi:hypothetical protein
MQAVDAFFQVITHLSAHTATFKNWNVPFSTNEVGADKASAIASSDYTSEQAHLSALIKLFRGRMKFESCKGNLSFLLRKNKLIGIISMTFEKCFWNDANWELLCRG